MKQAQEEFEQQLIDALDKVEKGYITEDRMAIIRYACGVVKKPAKPVVFDFSEIE